MVEIGSYCNILPFGVHQYGVCDLAFSIHSSRVSGGEVMNKIMVEICLLRPMEKWVMAVSLSSNCTLVARFLNSLISSWNPSLGVLCIFVLVWFLEESEYVTVCFYFGVKGIEVLVIVHNEFIEHLLFSFNARIGHPVIPLLQESNSLSSAHFAKNKGNLDLVRDIDSGVDREVCFYGLEPLCGKAVLISPVEVEVPVEDWVDMGFERLTGFTGGVGVWVTIVAGLTEVGTWGKELLGN